MGCTARSMPFAPHRSMYCLETLMKRGTAIKPMAKALAATGTHSRALKNPFGVHASLRPIQELNQCLARETVVSHTRSEAAGPRDTVPAGVERVSVWS